MKVHLMYPDRDFVLEQKSPEELPRARSARVVPPPAAQRPEEPAARQARALSTDLELDTLFEAMAGDDTFVFEVARKALLSAGGTDRDLILYRHDVLQDCAQNPSVIAELYAIATEACERQRKFYISQFLRYPASVLHDSTDALRMFVEVLKKLRTASRAAADRFRSQGFAAFFSMIQEELNDDYLAVIEGHLRNLKQRETIFLSAGLGGHNEGVEYVLREPPPDERNWLERLRANGRAAYTFRIHERDEAGARMLSELRDRGVNLVANALAQSADHILSFFHVLRSELAFYVGCLNLLDRLVGIGSPWCFPDPQPAGTRRYRSSGLYDVCLALTKKRPVVGNTIDGDRKALVIVTGANQGGKSTFLRSVGLAQVMMQAGMFVAAESFAAELCSGVFTHYRREEDATMTSGKFDEELARMSDIADAVRPGGVVLFNESFASTNEREGSEIARQVVCALRERGVKVFFVTHQYEFARSLFERRLEDALFLRAERHPDGTRTFKVLQGEPLETSFGQDLFAEVFSERRTSDALSHARQHGGS